MSKLSVLLVFILFINSVVFSQEVDTCYIFFKETIDYNVSERVKSRIPTKRKFLFIPKEDGRFNILFTNNAITHPKMKLEEREIKLLSYENPIKIYKLASKNPDNFIINVVKKDENGTYWSYKVNAEFPPPPPEPGPIPMQQNERD